MIAEVIYGTAPGATEERMTHIERFYSLDNRKFLGPKLQDPLSLQAELIFNELEISCVREDMPFYRNEDIRNLIGSLGWELGLRDWKLKNKLSQLVGGIEEFKRGTTELIRLMELAEGRARYEGRKRSIKRTVSTLKSRMKIFMDTYETLSPIHVLLQSHFIAQNCETPHRDSLGERLTIFYEPLYRHRDKYFQEPFGENLLNYLKCWEHLINEPYYKEYILKKGKKKKRERASARVQALADELKVYGLLAVTS